MKTAGEFDAGMERFTFQTKIDAGALGELVVDVTLWTKEVYRWDTPELEAGELISVVVRDISGYRSPFSRRERTLAEWLAGKDVLTLLADDQYYEKELYETAELAIREAVERLADDYEPYDAASGFF